MSGNPISLRSAQSTSNRASFSTQSRTHSAMGSPMRPSRTLPTTIISLVIVSASPSRSPAVVHACTDVFVVDLVHSAIELRSERSERTGSSIRPRLVQVPGSGNDRTDARLLRNPRDGCLRGSQLVGAVDAERLPDGCHGICETLRGLDPCVVVHA